MPTRSCALVLLFVVWADAAAAQGRSFGRLLGVFDDATGQPVVGAEVVDLSTNTEALTSSSGAVTLAWLPVGMTLL